MKPNKNWLEWSVFCISLLLVLSTFLFLLYWALNTPNSPPQIVVKLGQLQLRNNHYLIAVEVINEGDQTAEGVLVSVEQTSGNKEKAEFEIPFLPHNSSRQGTAIFSTNPGSAERLEAKVPGYRNP